MTQLQNMITAHNVIVQTRCSDIATDHIHVLPWNWIRVVIHTLSSRELRIKMTQPAQWH